MYQSLGKNFTQAQGLLQRVMRENAAAVLPGAQTRKRPDPPRNLISQPGPSSAFITWNAPSNLRAVAGYRVYRDNENNFLLAITDPTTRSVTVQMPASSSTFVYVSAVSGSGRESVKLQVMATSGAAAAASPVLPPGYQAEPTGGSQTRPPTIKTL